MTPRYGVIVTTMTKDLRAVVGGLAATILGPWLTQMLVRHRPVLEHAAFGPLAFWTLCRRLAMALVRHSAATGQHASGRAQPWPTTNQ